MPALAALQAGNLAEVKRLIVEKIRSLGTVLQQRVEALSKIQVDEARKEYEASAVRSPTISAAAIVGGLLFAGLFGFTMVRSITRQLGGEPGEAARLAARNAAWMLGPCLRL
jgi:hypothetical protein